MLHSKRILTVEELKWSWKPYNETAPTAPPPVEYALLTPQQLDGQACLFCGETWNTMAPIGWLNDGQVFTCSPTCRSHKPPPTPPVESIPAGRYGGPAEFLAVLYAAYLLRARRPYGSMEKLRDLYRILCATDAGKEYTLTEFTQEVHALDRCHWVESHTGLRFRLHRGSTAARRRSNLLILTTTEGFEHSYYAIEFLPCPGCIPFWPCCPDR